MPQCNQIYKPLGKRCIRLQGHEGLCRCGYIDADGLQIHSWQAPQQGRPVIVTTMLRTCPRCKGRVFKEAYASGMYFIACTTCDEFATFRKASDAVAAWCKEEVAA